MNNLNWLFVGLGSVLGVCITFGLIYKFGHSFFKRMDLEDRGSWDKQLAEPIPRDTVVVIYKRKKRYHRHNRHHYQHRRHPRPD
jgi:hypothetical protein